MPRTDDPDRLVRLMRQIAAADRTAFAELYDVLSPALIAVARSQALDHADAAAVVSAAFNEVWWMARFHTAADADIRAWTTDVVMRRARERSPSPGTWTASHDQHLRNTLSALLGPPSGYAWPRRA